MFCFPFSLGVRRTGYAHYSSLLVRQLRRDDYWRHYHLAHTHKIGNLVTNPDVSIGGQRYRNEPPIQVIRRQQKQRKKEEEEGMEA
jgi:hypothetical protein